VAMALRAGVPVGDLEFFQFHPTALHHPAMPRPLLSEALRGHGALLRDSKGQRFVDELAPRDVVSRAMADKMAEQSVDYLWLDATGLEAFGDRFPTVASSLGAAGLDPAVDWLPIAPAAHYLSGGVVTDLDGASAMPGLWAVGEVACTGVHGANRLASNSLLEGMVFGARLAEAIAAGRDGATASGVMRALSRTPTDALAGEIACVEIDSLVADQRLGTSTVAPVGTAAPDGDVAKLRERLQRAMTEGTGVLRSPQSTAVRSAAAAPIGPGAGTGRAVGELVNLSTVAGALLRAAATREETRGAHARRDFPEARPEWRCRLIHRGVSSAGALPRASGAPR
jgi:L-aspartate oxidase